jgi:hypothetical protein
MQIGSLFRAFDAVMAFRDAVRGRKAASASPDGTLVQQQAPSSTVGGQLEARLTNVVVAALKEAFDRDHARLELERAQLDEQRRRAEESLRVELQRQAADRELGRQRLLGATALVGWIASVLVLGFHVAAMTPAARAVLAGGWALQLGALACAFSAQSRVSAYLPDGRNALVPGRAAALSLWLLIAGLALTALSLLL